MIFIESHRFSREEYLLFAYTDSFVFQEQKNGTRSIRRKKKTWEEEMWESNYGICQHKKLQIFWVGLEPFNLIILQARADLESTMAGAINVLKKRNLVW